MTLSLAESGIADCPFVKTDVKQYIERENPVVHHYCVSCVNCIKHKDQLLQFKYNSAMKSNYAANFVSSPNSDKGLLWNLDAEKRKIKVSCKMPISFESTYDKAFSQPQSPSNLNKLGHYKRT